MRINEMEVEKSGQGPAVILVHGLGGTGNVWFPQTAELEKSHTVYRPDLNGAGRSSLNGELSVEDFIRDLLTLMDSESLERASFVGHSFGSLIVDRKSTRLNSSH